MAKGKEFKRPSNKIGKNFRIPDKELSINYDHLKPIFSLKHLQYQGPHCISRCENIKKARILDNLLRLSQSTWSQLRGYSKKVAFEIIPHDRFKVSLPAIITPEVPILVMQYDAGDRIAGFRENDIFHIVLAGKDLYSH